MLLLNIVSYISTFSTSRFQHMTDWTSRFYHMLKKLKYKGELRIGLVKWWSPFRAFLCYVICWGSDSELERRKNFANLKLNTSHVKWGVDWWPPLQSTLHPTEIVFDLLGQMIFPSVRSSAFPHLILSEHQTRDVITVQSSSSRNVGRSVVVTFLNTPRLACVALQ